jgi:hypothetical protein
VNRAAEDHVKGSRFYAQDFVRVICVCSSRKHGSSAKHRHGHSESGDGDTDRNTHTNATARTDSTGNYYFSAGSQFERRASSYTGNTRCGRKPRRCNRRHHGQPGSNNERSDYKHGCAVHAFQQQHDRFQQQPNDRKLKHLDIAEHHPDFGVGHAIQHDS